MTLSSELANEAQTITICNVAGIAHTECGCYSFIFLTVSLYAWQLYLHRVNPFCTTRGYECADVGGAGRWRDWPSLYGPSLLGSMDSALMVLYVSCTLIPPGTRLLCSVSHSAYITSLICLYLHTSRMSSTYAKHPYWPWSTPIAHWDVYLEAILLDPIHILQAQHNLLCRTRWQHLQASHHKGGSYAIQEHCSEHTCRFDWSHYQAFVALASSI